ncbi:cupin domain-containing protein [Paenibacillus sp. CAA11]|uniref:cupin domain-containing protein n=1 Tax=Paenibacillus sp. CAA11 TaxID=1532905 RepID=UPI000D3A6B25|nr:cupin domain-containing protein [Paenibacillus sp. CAA11]AWB45592.1 cupin domain-containing protein [Paenibacillus sp. CAA11]
MNKKVIQEFQQYQEDRFTKRIIFHEGESTVFLLNFMPGQELPAHNHPGADVFITALTGSGTMVVDGKEHALAQGEAIHIAGNEVFAYRNSGGEPVSLYVVLAKVPDERYVKEI